VDVVGPLRHIFVHLKEYPIYFAYLEEILTPVGAMNCSRVITLDTRFGTNIRVLSIRTGVICLDKTRHCDTVKN
jgi:hypothetical protein